MFVSYCWISFMWNPKTGKNIQAKYQTIRQSGGRVGVDPAPTGNWGEEAGQGSGGSQLQNWFSPNGQILILINVFSASSESQGLGAQFDLFKQKLRFVILPPLPTQPNININ